MLQVNAQAPKCSDVKFGVKQLNAYDVPVLGVSFVVGVFHETVVLENGHPIGVVAHFFPVVCACSVRA